ncbi:putative sulfate exporter family transporter [Labilibaculum sp. DW002]|uniref:Sulfate exporter family transporter n=1 Tax=Paralabilibaculum antarcticum TaxID=2912572 RepID=A0ABT5VWI7_9BACT|nr:putative sulfate exporter family transporter [Labilibaculum sp. DW002]MDE5419657.1 putative sulfate exporter family transporter [Labilibaculum sp. DW002]
MPGFSPAIALIMGLFFSMFGIKTNRFTKHTSSVLQASIVLMGFGMNLSMVMEASKSGFGFTAVSVIATISIGLLLGKLLRVEKATTILIAAGTAICGGSAIAAVAPVINAKNKQVLFAMAVVFVLNSLALMLFPIIGHYFEMSQETFGFWSAIAIHDTSSVVGASAAYGEQALEIATTVKLTRALWIIPVSIVFAIFNKNSDSGKIKIPWFIGVFVLAIIVAHLFPQWQEGFAHLKWLGKKGMVIALLFIGSSISVSEIKETGGNTFLLGIITWIIIGGSSLYFLQF